MWVTSEKCASEMLLLCLCAEVAVLTLFVRARGDCESPGPDSRKGVHFLFWVSNPACDSL